MRHRNLPSTSVSFALIGALSVAVGCSPARQEVPADPRDMSSLDMSDDADGSVPITLDLGYLCGRYSNYQAQVSGIVRSPCDYDVSKILSLGSYVQTKINPPTISMLFPDGTSFSGTTDGVNFTATRITNFPYEDGCNWQATETMTGTIDAANQCTLHTSYTYREKPVSSGSCATPCTIDAQLIINWVSIIVG